MEGGELSFYERPYAAAQEMGLARNGIWTFPGHEKYCSNLKTFEFRRKDRKTNKTTPLISIAWIPSSVWEGHEQYDAEIKARLSATRFRMNVYQKNRYFLDKDCTVVVYFPDSLPFEHIESWVTGIVAYLEMYHTEGELPSFTPKELQRIRNYYLGRKLLPGERGQMTSSNPASVPWPPSHP